MLNQIVLAGRIAKEIEDIKLENGKGASIMTLSVSRNYKNKEGEYDRDYIDCILYNGIANNCKEYCKKEDLVGIKGHLQSRTNIEENSKTLVVVEKVTFLSSKLAK